ncbi:MAG: hypothetical protein ACI9XK_002143 [Granulosicoccus sp.]|jgi:hypothetical protein
MRYGMKLKACVVGLVFGTLLPTSVQAASLDSLEALSQANFLRLSENLAAAIHYKAVGPAEPLGLIGFDIGLELSSTEIDEALFDEASSGDFGTPEIFVPRIHVNKGLPFGLDVGAALSVVPDTDITVISGELRYALLSGGAVTPSVGVRASHAILAGLSEIDMSSSALEITASKGFIIFTPYVGAGIVKSSVTPNNLGALTKESFDQTKLYVGVTISLGVALTLEIDRTGDFRTYSAKFGFRF